MNQVIESRRNLVNWEQEELLSDQLGVFVLWIVSSGCSTVDAFDSWFSDSDLVVRKAEQLADRGFLSESGDSWRQTDLGCATLHELDNAPCKEASPLTGFFNYLRGIVNLNASTMKENISEVCKLTDLVGSNLMGTHTVDTGRSQYDADFQVPLETLDERAIVVRMDDTREVYTLHLVSSHGDTIEYFRPDLGRCTLNTTFDIPFTDEVPANMAAALVRQMIRSSKESEARLR